MRNLPNTLALLFATDSRGPAPLYRSRFLPSSISALNLPKPPSASATSGAPGAGQAWLPACRHTPGLPRPGLASPEQPPLPGWKLPTVFIAPVSVKRRLRRCRSWWCPASAVQTPSLTRHKPVVAIPGLGPREALITHPRRRHAEGQGGGRWMVLGITAGCKVGAFHLRGAGSSHCHRGPRPQGNEAGDPCSGSCPRSPPDTSICPVLHGIQPWPQNDRFTGAPNGALRQVLLVACDE